MSAKLQPMVTTYVRLPQAERDRIDKAAEAEGLNSSDIYRRAVRIYLAGGADAWLALEKDKLARLPAEVDVAIWEWVERIRSADPLILDAALTLGERAIAQPPLAQTLRALAEATGMPPHTKSVARSRRAKPRPE